MTEPTPEEPDFDVVVVGAGMAGIYAVHRFVSQGLRVQGFESAGGVGGVWYHNKYPGARVDVDSVSYSYHFSAELYNEWTWSERLAPQPEILAYLQYAAAKFDVPRHFRFDCKVEAATWDAESHLYRIVAANGPAVTSRFIVMASGHLSEPRAPDFPGFADYQGKWIQTAHWPDHDVDVTGLRVGVIGTGSSGVQVIPHLAKDAEHLYVFQRTPNYGVPAKNGPIDETEYRELKAAVPEFYNELVNSSAGMRIAPPAGRASEFTAEERANLLEERWQRGGQNMNMVFSDQGTNHWANDIVSEFVRAKIRDIITDPEVAGKLIPREYPISTRRLGVNTSYYETYNRDNVTLVDVKADPIVGFTPTGITTRRREFPLDLVVFALGFEAFTGSIAGANIRNELGERATDNWGRGPLTYLGLMTHGFPNLFFITGAGSPSVLANLFVQSVFHVDVIGDLMAHVQAVGATTVEPTEEAQEQWSLHVDEVATPMLRRQYPNYMVHINRDDGSRRFIPYAGGLGRYVSEVNDIIDRDYVGFDIS